MKNFLSFKFLVPAINLLFLIIAVVSFFVAKYYVLAVLFILWAGYFVYDFVKSNILVKTVDKVVDIVDKTTDIVPVVTNKVEEVVKDPTKEVTKVISLLENVLGLLNKK